MDYFDYYDEVYTDIYLEFGSEAVSDPAYAEELLSKSQKQIGDTPKKTPKMSVVGYRILLER